ncbi:MAG: efflux RND transporter periplasmic adaptor subunit [Deltaproteobacteria bacterium]|nr:efflux RND transporter periplasmic adaptor subunit [Deltaproteobacteria bacterium]
MTTQSNDDLGFELPGPVKSSRTRVAVVLGAIVVVAFVVGYTQHHRSAAQGATVPTAGDDTSALRVEVVKPKMLASDRALELAGTIKPLEETKLYPRTSGYVRRWLVDIGDKVKEGQLLAEIDTPELDAQISQARAQLAAAQAAVKQAVANRDYTRSSSNRYETLAQQQLVSKSQVEQQQAAAATGDANLAAAQSNVSAADANLRRLLDSKSFANVTAPFAGTITTRTIDRGSLVADNGTTPMFTLVATDPVRVFIDVPQTVAPSITSGTTATISVREYGGRVFTGKVTRAAGALDPSLHTMQTEIQVPNGDGALLPGMFCTAAITLPVPHNVVEIPATALYSDAQGLRVATVDAQNKIHYVPITIERDTGATLWVATGLAGEERVVKIAVSTLAEGDIVEAKLAAGSAAGSPAGSAARSGSK